MSLNYEKRYAYAEVECILEWLGDEYIEKIPKKLLRRLREEKKFGYNPQIDFTKSLEAQIRQETKNIIAYLNCKYWIENFEEKERIEKCIEENSKIEKEKQRIERLKEIKKRAQMMNQMGTSNSVETWLKK